MTTGQSQVRQPINTGPDRQVLSILRRCIAVAVVVFGGPVGPAWFPGSENDLGGAWAQVPSHSVTMSDADYRLIYGRDVFSDSLLPASFESDGSVWPSIQVRFKGNSTRYYAKKSWRLRFSTSQLYNGVRQLNLNSMYTDKSFLREKLAWDLFGDIGALAPTAWHGLLDVNGSPKGLFLLIPKVDRYLLQANGRTVAPMYEANDFWTMADLSVQPDSLLKLYYDKEIGDASDYSDLAALIDALNATPDADFADSVHSLFDIPSVLGWFAVNTLTMMGDSYNKNYLLYLDTTRTTSRWQVIPWDYDLSWGRTGDLAVPYPASLLNDGFAYTFSPLSGPANVLKDRFLADTGLTGELRRYLDTLLSTVFTESRFHPRIDSLAALVRFDVGADPQKWGTVQDFEDHVEALKYYVTARRNYLGSTFVRPPAGEYNISTVVPTGVGIPHHAVGYDGRLIATFWFHDLTGLDSILVRVWPDSTPPHVTDPVGGRYVRRWLSLTPYPDPDTARFLATVRWEYQDVASTDREVGAGVGDERQLRVYHYGGASGTGWRPVSGRVNPYANTAVIDSVDEFMTVSGAYFALQLSETYDPQWTRHPGHYWERLTSGDFVDKQNGYMAGEHGTFLRTTDGGATWIRDSVGTALHVLAADADSATNVLLVAGESGLLYRSTDGGVTFDDAGTVTPHTLRGVDAGPLSVAAGDRGTVLVSFDQGVSWETADVGITDDIQAVAAPDYRIFCAGPSIRILIQGFSGAWLVSETIGLPHMARAIEVVGNRIWVAGDSGMVGFIEGNEPTWHGRLLPVKFRLNDIGLVDSARIYVAGEGGAIYHSADTGLTWYRQHTGDSHDLYSIAFTAPDRGYSAGTGGTILRTMEEGILTDARPPYAWLPSEFGLQQNFPNPFNPSTRIRFRVPAGGAEVSLVIFDVLGQLADEPMTGYVTGGTHEVEWTPSGLASGVYFCRFTYAAGGHTGAIVNKMIFLR